MPASLTPCISSSTSHPTSTTNVIQQQACTPSLQSKVVLHSIVDEPPTSTTNHFNLDLTVVEDENEKADLLRNNLMTVSEQSSTSDLVPDDSQHLKSPTNTSDIVEGKATDEIQTV